MKKLAITLLISSFIFTTPLYATNSTLTWTAVINKSPSNKDLAVKRCDTSVKEQRSQATKLKCLSDLYEIQLEKSEKHNSMKLVHLNY
ncbi:hypothetical protein RC083_06775 [Pseudoalteromonas haloplanktis]|uniref:Orphan protein n=1 Tax=Pseudoalteromonas haloplanktis TaxID=228 RepID=A0ABU1B9T9_PSEHA|nr:hypothetical protein [Pseudoalteromonas haloplanktis]MDQ9091294.1 hypothetical protein [Pseudoalteromonas haloplanktis]